MSKTSVKPLELVVSAIHCLKEKKGSSPQNILKYLSGKYDADTELLRVHVQAGLRRGVSFGLITNNSGLYRLNEILSAPLEKERSNCFLKAGKTVQKKKRSKLGEKRGKQRYLKCCNSLKNNVKRRNRKRKKQGMSSRRNDCQKVRRAKQHKAKGKRVQKGQIKKNKKTCFQCSQLHLDITEPQKPVNDKEPEDTSNIVKT